MVGTRFQVGPAPLHLQKEASIEVLQDCEHSNGFAPKPLRWVAKMSLEVTNHSHLVKEWEYDS